MQRKMWLIIVVASLLPVAVCQSAETAALDSSIEVAPLKARLSQAEKQQENSSDLSYIEKETELPDLPCTDEKLRQQIKKYIFANITEHPTNSVLTKRERVLLVNNLHEFKEISEENIKGKNNFMIRAALMNLKINQKRQINHVCVSQDNDSQKFQNIYVVIYRYIGYYKIMIANLLNDPEEQDEATFIYNW